MTKNAYPHETVYRAFMLFMDYIPPNKIIKILSSTHGENNTPQLPTILNWRNNGEGTGGVSWNHIREVTDQVRGKASSDLIRERYKRQGKGPSQYVDWANQTMNDLEEAQNKIMEGVKVGYIDMKLSDLPNLIKSRHLIEGLATSRTEHQGRHVEVLGKIIYQAGTQVISDHRMDSIAVQAVTALLDLVASEFTRYLAFGGDPERYEIEVGRAVNLRLLQQGTEGAGIPDSERPIQREISREASDSNPEEGMAKGDGDGLENSDDRGEG